MPGLVGVLQFYVLARLAVAICFRRKICWDFGNECLYRQFWIPFELVQDSFSRAIILEPCTFYRYREHCFAVEPERMDGCVGI